LCTNYDLIKDNSGLTATRNYSLYGEITSSTGTPDRYGYTGREQNAVTGLMHYRDREHAGGAWLTPDPIGFAAGDTNLYRYEGNDPANATDPSGLQPPTGPFNKKSVPETISNCAMGRLRVPVAGNTYPPPWYGYPPALIPMWSEGFIYVGLWKHWFTERPLSFVRIYVRAGHSIVEIARTPEQFLCYTSITAIVAHDGVRPEDDPSGFAAIRQFQTDTPLASVADVARYDGWFPRVNFATAIPWWRHCCSLEVSDDVRAVWPATVLAPPWVAAPPTPQMFRDFVQAGDYRSAWLTLNSAGWPLPDARAAIGQLAAAAGDGTFSTLADAWLAASNGQSGGY
jgi:RHS repeat-associated protein